MSTVPDNKSGFSRLYSYLIPGLVFWVPLFISMYFAFTSRAHSITTDFSDVVLHAFAFTYLTASLGLSHFRNVARYLPAVWMMGYGLFIEFVQYFLPARSFELGDIGVDVLGILFGLFLLRIVLLPLLARLQTPPS